MSELLNFQAGGNAKLPSFITTFSLPAGHSCPGAHDCLAKADPDTGRLQDHHKAKFRCYAASQECAFSTVRRVRWHNFILLQQARTKAAMRDLILRSIDPREKYVRVHVSGDFFSQPYFDAWMEVAEQMPHTIFYAYTKSLNYWAARITEIPRNFHLNASMGGKFDHLIARLHLKYVRVVFHPDEASALKLEIDHDDSHAYESRKSFALLLHGQQKAGSAAAEALKVLKSSGVEFSYAPNKRPRCGIIQGAQK